MSTTPASSDPEKLCEGATIERAFVNYTFTGLITETSIVFTPTDSRNPAEWQPWTPKVLNGQTVRFVLSRANSPRSFEFHAATFWIDSANPLMPARSFRAGSEGQVGPLNDVLITNVEISAHEIEFCVVNRTREMIGFPIGLEATLEDPGRPERRFLLTSRDPQIEIEGEDGSG